MDSDADEDLRPPTNHLGQRIGGALMLANALLVFAERLWTPARGALPDDFAGGSIVGGIFDVVVGYALLRGNQRIVGLAIVRVVLGLALFGLLKLSQGEAFLAAVQVAVSGAFLLLLIGRAGKPRIAVASLLFGLYVLLEGLGFYALHTGHNPIGTFVAQLRGDIEAGPAGELTGTGGYSLRAPSDAWRRRTSDAARKDNPLAEHWLTRPDIDAHAVVIPESAPGAALPVDALTQAVIDNAHAAATRFEVLENSPSPRYPEDGRILRGRGVIDGVELEFLYGVFSTYGHDFQVVTFASVETFAAIEPELRALVDSFTMPTTITPLETPERSPAARVEGVAAPYAFTAPSDRWYLRTAEATHAGNPVVDRQIVRPERDASVFVIVEDLPEAMTIDQFTKAVETSLAARAPDLTPAQRWSAGKLEGRLIHARVLNGSIALDYDYATFVVGQRGFQVVGFSRSDFYSLVKPELLATLASFEPPPAP